MRRRAVVPRPWWLTTWLLAVALMVCACTATRPAATSPSASVPTGATDTAGPDAAFVDAGSTGVTITDGDDWTLPAWVRPAPGSGLFSEDADPDHRVLVRSLDLSWRQLAPRPDGPLDRTSSGTAQGLSFDPLDDQLAEPGDFWMRVFASGEDWAPTWVAERCGVRTYGPDYDGQRHLPIWDECVWTELLRTYRALFVDGGLAADPRLRFVYVPGAFTWAEYDYEMITAAVEAGDLDWETYRTWYEHAMTDLVALFGDHADKLVFTGEDYPFGPFGARDDLLARQAVDAGMGIRTGITEVSNFHLSEAPAYGSSVAPNGHLVVDESLPIHDGRRVVAGENECYTDCGYHTDDPYYAVRQSNLKALQLRMNWMYLVPGPSYVDEYPEHWDWLRLSLGRTASTSADAWAALRDAEDTYWDDDDPEHLGRFADPEQWRTRPWVRNLERWLVQVDEPGSVAHRTDADVHRHVLEEDNGVAHEGLSTDVAAGVTGFVLDADRRFVEAAGDGRLVVKITYLDRGTGSFTVDTAAGSSAAVRRADTGTWRTATVALPEGGLGSDPAHPGRLRLALADGADDLVVRFVRLVRVSE